MLAAGLADAQQPAPGKKAPAAAAVTESQAQASAILMRMADFLGGAQRFSVSLRAGYDAVQKSGQKIEFGETRKVTLSRPDRLRVEGERSDGAKMLIVFNGKEITLIDATSNVYATAPQPGGLDDSIVHFVRDLGMRLPLAVLLVSQLPAELKDRVQSVDYVEKTSIHGSASHHLAARTDTVDFQVWVADGDTAAAAACRDHLQEGQGRAAVLGAVFRLESRARDRGLDVPGEAAGRGAEGRVRGAASARIAGERASRLRIKEPSDEDHGMAWCRDGSRRGRFHPGPRQRGGCAERGRGGGGGGGAAQGGGGAAQVAAASRAAAPRRAGDFSGGGRSSSAPAAADSSRRGERSARPGAARAQSSAQQGRQGAQASAQQSRQKSRASARMRPARTRPSARQATSQNQTQRQSTATQMQRHPVVDREPTYRTTTRRQRLLQLLELGQRRRGGRLRGRGNRRRRGGRRASQPPPTTVVTRPAPAPAAVAPPCNVAPVPVSGVPYYKCGATWYTAGYASSGVVYMPVPPPPGY